MSSLLLFALVAGPAVLLTPEALWEAWPEARFVASAAPCLRHADLVERLRALEASHKGGELRLEEVGHSVEGRAIHLLTVGSGPRKVLLWSQMHGDEPSATPALLDLTDFLLSRRDSDEARTILSAFTLLMVPMLNPDGAARGRRYNAAGIDVNRDARRRTSREAEMLARLSSQPTRAA